MSWTNPDGPWQRAQRKRLRLAQLGLWLGLAVDVVVIAVLIVAFLMLTRASRLAPAAGWPGSKSWFLLPVAVFLFVSVLPTIQLVRRVRIERTVLERVPAHDGAVCVKCRREDLEAVPGAGTLRCPKCGMAKTPAELEAFWEEYPLQASMPPAARSEAAREPGTSLPGSKAPRFLQFLWRHPGYTVLAMLGAWVVLAGAFSIIIGGHVIANLVQTAWCVAIPLALMLWSLGSGRRVGDSIHCAACEYERTDAADAKCPECGASWREPGGYVRGKTVRSPGLKWAGIGGGVLVAAFFLGTLAGALARVTPTWLLIDQICGTRGFVMDEWAELLTRTLDREQSLELMEGLLEKRADKGYISTDGNDWLAARVTDGTMPAELVARLYDDMLELRVADPAATTAGTATALTLDVRDSRPLWHGAELLIVVESMTVDDAPVPLPNDPPAAVWDLLETGHRRHRYTTPVFTPSEAGEVHVRLVLWHVYAPSGVLTGPFDRADDGTLIIPPQAIWSRRIELEHEVRVTPRRRR